MKKNKFEGKLSLNKETIAKLNEEQMVNLKGGEVRKTIVLCLSISAGCSARSCSTLICL